MKMVRMLIVPALAALLVMTVSCEEELNTLGEGVIGGEPFNTGSVTYEVFATNKNIEAVQTNGLPLYQLGVFNDPIYGRTTASITTQLTLPAGNAGLINTFGNSSADENEQVQEVFLYLPFQLAPNSNMDTDQDGVNNGRDEEPLNADNDSDGDGLSNREERARNLNPLSRDTDGDGVLDGDENQEDDPSVVLFPQEFDLDSIYGNRNATFRLRVERLNFFLRDFDPNSNFEEAQQYFSNQEFSPAFVDEVLYDDNVTISTEQLIFFTEDDNGNQIIDPQQSLNPGLRVQLDADFFQRNILDKEGDSELLSQANFEDFFRGIHISAEMALDNEVSMLFNLAQANINVVYTFDITSGDGNVEAQERTYTLGLGGNAVNTFINETYPPEIENNLNTGENASRLFVKGGSGIISEISLFGEDGGEAIINEIRANNWIINEANLIFNVDDAAFGGSFESVVEPPRLYLYNAETNGIIFNPLTEINNSDTALGIFLNYDGLLNRNGSSAQYTINVTEHLNNIIIRDSANAKLALVQSADIRIPFVAEALGQNDEVLDIDVPIAASISPLGTVLFGNNVESENEDKRLRLQIFFTETN